MQKKINFIFGFLFYFSLILISPLYFFELGMPQPGHWLMIVSSIIIIYNNRINVFNIVKSNIFLLIFLALVFLINSAYGIFYSNLSFFVSSTYWLYCLLILLSVMCICKIEKLNSIIKGLIIFHLILITILYFCGVGGFTFYPRYEYFFLSPNQLGHFVLCMLILYLVIDEGELKNDFYIVYALSLGLILTTGGRSLYLALVPFMFSVIYLSKNDKRKILNYILITIVVAIGFLNYVPDVDWIEQNQKLNVFSSGIKRLAELCVNCGESDYYSISSQLYARGYGRILDYPYYILWGAGQGMDGRFNNTIAGGYEIHSSLFAVLFYYGLLGLVIFLLSIWKLAKYKTNLLLMTPLLVYGFFTYGLRSVYFWVLLGFVVSYKKIFSFQK